MLYSPDWTNTGFSFILLTVNPFRHSTLTEHGLYCYQFSDKEIYWEGGLKPVTPQYIQWTNHHADLTVSNFIGSSIGPKRVNFNVIY